jgi:putative addiction module component (TIGR02574 family)
MTEHAKQLLAEALRLPENDRGDLAARLIESLDPVNDEEIEAAWGAEIQKRLEELRTGQVQSMSWAEARRKILEDTDDFEQA